MLIRIILLTLIISSCIQNTYIEEGYKVKVIKVVDGDTFYAIIDERVIKVRILGIDTPEILAERNKPYEYGNITNITCLAEWGKIATDFLKKKIEGKTVLLIFDKKVGKKDKYGRFLAYVYHKNEDIAVEMLKLGYARVFVDDFEKLKEYLSYQNLAVKEKTGLWSCS